MKKPRIIIVTGSLPTAELVTEIGGTGPRSYQLIPVTFKGDGRLQKVTVSYKPKTACSFLFSARPAVSRIFRPSRC